MLKPVRTGPHRIATPARRLAVVALLATSGAAAGCRGLQTYEPLIEPVNYLDLRLDPCPQSPNCVSSQAWDETQRVAPIPFEGDAEAALDRFVELIEADGARVVLRREFHLRAEYRSRVFGFVDDVELLADEESGVVQVRSASRRGYYDLGANRRRIERLREAFAPELVPLR